METINIFESLFGHALVIGMAMVRIAIAFMLLPIFSSELIPAMIRNAMFVALALIVVMIQPAIDVNSFSTQDWMLLFGKEIFIGVAIGVFFGVHLWAFETAGQIIDIQIGAGTAQIFDPLSGHQTTLVGAFLGRLANYVFMAAGGLMLLTGAIMESYSIWPIDRSIPDLAYAGVTLFEQEFGYFFKLALLISSPILVVTFLVDESMGLINRYAQQFNVFFLSMSIKMFSAIFMLLISVVFLVELLIKELTTHSGELLLLLQRLLGT